MAKAKESNIITIAFDGPNRSGKGTQIGLLEKYLKSEGIPFITIRGDGSRTNKGERPGDPYSEWWEEHLKLLRSPESPIEAWDEASYRLAREQGMWKRRCLPRRTEPGGRGVIIVDRSLLSRIMIIREYDPRYLEDMKDEKHQIDLYPRRPGLMEQVKPDILFFLWAPPDILLERLDPNDPKYEFRRRLILEKANLFPTAAAFLRRHIPTLNLISLDASLPPKYLHHQIRRILQTLFQI